jgi:hypothetical protein
MVESLTVESQDGTATQTIAVNVNGADEATTGGGGGGGTTPPADPILNFFIGPEKFPTPMPYDILDFTNNDLLHFINGIKLAYDNVGNPFIRLVDRIPNDGVLNDSTLIEVAVPTASGFSLISAVYLVGFSNLDNAQMTFS